MARGATGQVIAPKGKGRSWAIRFRANGERHYVTLGRSDEGWNRREAELELENVLADVRRGIWQGPRPEPAPEPVSDPSFRQFASEWFAGLQSEGLTEATLADYRWQVCNHLLPFFAEHRLSQITVAEVDRYRQTKVAEGRLSPASINKTLTRLGQILDVACEREQIERNPLRVNPRRRKLKEARPQRTYLDSAEQISALLDAAGELDKEARSDRRGTSRRALLATYALAGLRLGEALGLRWRDVDLASGRLKVGRAKTDAGVRVVELVPALRDDLAAYKAKARSTAANDLVFGTATGRQLGPSNVRRRILAKSVERANGRLAERDLPPLPEGLTPHSLRRTFASVLFALGRELPYAMAQLGHTDPKMTLGVYARVMLGGDEEREALRALVEGSDATEGQAFGSESKTLGTAATASGAVARD